MPKCSALETSRRELSEDRIVRCWRPLGCRAVELGKPPQEGVIYTVVYGSRRLIRRQPTSGTIGQQT